MGHSSKMKVFVLLLCGLAVARAGEWEDFKKTYGEVYPNSSEEQFRKSVFEDKLKFIAEHNARFEKGLTTYTVGMNHFGDMTQEEIKNTMMGLKMGPPPAKGIPHRRSVNNPLESSWDWREKGAVTPVKDQGQCGSCWAFATTEVIESHVQIATGSLPVLSAQQVTSCTPNPLHCGGTGGCRGSIPQLGFTYIQLFGHVEEDAYPYVSGSSGSTEDCEYNLDNVTPVVGLTGYTILTANNVQAVMEHVATVGPLSVAVDASNWSWYSGGVFDGCSYDQNIALNHAVVLVGYGTDSAEGDYWLVRNSWGTWWGEDGYIRLKRESSEVCGVDSTPMDGTACEGGPGNDQQTVCGMCGVLFDVSYPLGAHMFEKP